MNTRALVVIAIIVLTPVLAFVSTKHSQAESQNIIVENLTAPVETKLTTEPPISKESVKPNQQAEFQVIVLQLERPRPVLKVCRKILYRLVHPFHRRHIN